MPFFRFATGSILLEYINDKELIRITNKNNGSIIFFNDIPDDLRAASSFLSPRFPNVIIEAISIAIGKANGINLAAA